MDKISESLIILDHFGRIIESKSNYCKRYTSFRPKDFIQMKLSEYFEKGYDLKYLEEEKILDEISRECSDIQITLHNYTRLNIIDMFSFNDEYNKYFNENNCDNPELKNRIRKVKEKNRPIRKNLDWAQLKRLRNVVMAHNLRDRNDSNRLALGVLKEINELVMNHIKAIEYANVILLIFNNIKEEFYDEINVANQEFIKKAKASSINDIN